MWQQKGRLSAPCCDVVAGDGGHAAAAMSSPCSAAVGMLRTRSGFRGRPADKRARVERVGGVGEAVRLIAHERATWHMIPRPRDH